MMEEKKEAKRDLFDAVWLIVPSINIISVFAFFVEKLVEFQ
jgi:hypothetical protein